MKKIKKAGDMITKMNAKKAKKFESSKADKKMDKKMMKKKTVKKAVKKVAKKMYGKKKK